MRLWLDSGLDDMREPDAVAVRGLVRSFEDHEKEDERRFQEVMQRIDASNKTLREDVTVLAKAVTEAISGDSIAPGIRERVRSLEEHKIRTETMLDEQSKARAKEIEQRDERFRAVNLKVLSLIGGLIVTVIGTVLNFFLTGHGVPK